jgi:oligopeptide transport system ATP-binding protein
MATDTRQRGGGARQTHTAVGDVLIDVKDLKMHFPVTAGFIIQKVIANNRAIDGITFHVNRGETLGLVGESGCGKSTTGRCVLQLYKHTAGTITFDGRDMSTLRGNEMRLTRRRMQMIFQDPYASLNPRMTIRDIIGEPLVIHGLAKGSVSPSS